jgi:diguanylate cyclase (GGDEF)-like protein
MGVKAVAMIKSGRTGSFTIRIDPAADQPLWFEVIANPIEDGSGRVVAISRDISHQKRSEEKALWMAHHDALTGLPNRPVLQQRLDALLMDGGKGMVAALLILDVDNFKLINDTLGHDAGDALLSTFADRLRSALSDQDLVARTGGDEFAVIICAESEEEVYASVENIFARLREPFSHDGRLLECSASIGASFIPRHGTVRAEILKAADIALYAAKTGGRAQLKVFEPSMMVEVDRHQMMIAAARQALNVDSIVPHYQPIIALGSGTVIGFEALLRWRDSEGKLRVPQSLSAAFEDPRLGHVLGERMLDKVLCDVSAWIADGVQFGHVAINVAAVDFRSGTFAETLLERLERALQVLSSHGVRIALDDFGTGYASLSHLNHYPVDLLKIDRSFIAQIGNSADAAAICSAVINLGQCLGMEVIAEGVETPEQEAYLLSVGCNMGQGYLYARALAAAEVPPLVASQPFKARAMDPKASVA